MTEDRLVHAREQGQAQFDSIKEMVEAQDWDAVQEDALSVEVRTDWHPPGIPQHDGNKPTEYRILLCTGGPACQIVGTLSPHSEPETAIMQVQDWFTQWTEI